YYKLGDTELPPSSQPPPTTLTLESPVVTDPFAAEATFTARLQNQSGVAVPGQTIAFTLGQQRQQAITGSDGRATVTMQILNLPGEYQLEASLAGSVAFASSSASIAFTITKQDTVLTLTPFPDSSSPNLRAELKDATGRALGEQSIFFEVRDGSGTLV